MTISIWRYSHLALAISSFLLLTLASITGIILAFEPVSEKIQPYRVNNFDGITLAQALPVLRKTYPDISELKVNASQFVQINGSDANGEKLLAYVDPLTGKILGSPKEQNEFFKWITALHRSLFLHETGRFFIGLTAFLLLLITVSGTMLIIQRQRGLKRFFTRIARDNFAQYYHVVLGRWSLVPIVIIALTGTYLSLVRFELIGTPKESAKVDFDAIRSEPAKNPADMDIFKNTKFSDVESIEFPFSEDAEDYYTFKLKTREIAVNQITGDILSEVKYPTQVLLTNLSLNLHTGRASALWAIILAVASANILFFIYSGFAITWKRLSNRTKNKYSADESKYIILVGSENGSTFGFAQAIHQQLIKAGEKSFLSQLNNYTVFPKAENLIVLTATYGLGDAPTNAGKFAALLEKHQQPQPVHYSVLGFGSHAYPDFCKFAYEVNNLLSRQTWAVPLTDVHTVNDKSPDDFSLWAEAWSQQIQIPLTILPELQSAASKRLETLTVNTAATESLKNGTFAISFQTRKRLRVKSGDLLAIYPENDYRERLYSIGIVDKEIRLSVRLHPGGLGSSYLHRLTTGEKIRAKVIKNEHFHFPEKAPEVVMISNGTGIAPFLGMVGENKDKVPCHLYCGFREQSSYEMYQSLLETNQAAGKLVNINTAFSRAGEKQYVSDLIAKDADLIGNILNKGGVLMICGSLSMQKDVIELLETICQSKTGNSISFYQSHNQIRTDCY
ncbi:PepSY domain-containing protein [Pedobacter metabolipauper]|uniref:Sulfite reductase (NADPH) flavoprotein alpha-component n=1 Tax=Pedobacter metabolipauper TaxID=425513 RepID=A0A4R6SWH7_9SPHI|nr:PepSY domain-containing protein [Pedobacter metabolipauper]TDQ09771.1 sulfite reductase (NADPH) flavoprotein alpha-component [Pedobacter metabolipauper]